VPGETPTASNERYLEAIYILERTGGAIAARIGERLGVRAASVTQALRRLEAAGWLQQDGRQIRLTTAGTRLAEQIMRRHRVLERWLVEGLGLGWAQAHAEAQRMEHSVSPEVVDRLYVTLGRPSVCPHGNPIPGERGLPPYAGHWTLDEAPAERPLRVARIAEDAEESAASLAEMERLGLRPGASVRVQAVVGELVRLETPSGAHAVVRELAAKVWVDPGDEPAADRQPSAVGRGRTAACAAT
jgi:DtxR family Mn-dependent transcriptional regulator